MKNVELNGVFKAGICVTRVNPKAWSKKTPPKRGFLSVLRAQSELRKLTNHCNLLALASFVGVQRQGTIFNVALFVKCNIASHAFVGNAFELRQILGWIG